MAQVVERSRFVGAFGTDAMRLPDVVVEGSTREDWVRVAAAIRDRGWAVRSIEDFAVKSDDHGSVALEPIPSVRINFFNADEVTFDFDLAEMDRQEAVDAVCDLARTCSLAVGGAALMIPEGMTSADAVIRYSPRDDAFTVVD